MLPFQFDYNIEIRDDSPTAKALRATAKKKLGKLEQLKWYFYAKSLKKVFDLAEPLRQKKGDTSSIIPYQNLHHDESENSTNKLKSDSTRSIRIHDTDGTIRSIGFLGRMKSRSKRIIKAKKSENVQGLHIEKEHELYTLSFAVMLGLRYSIFKTNKQLQIDRNKNRWLETEEFMHTDKYEFRPKGTPKGPPPHRLGHTFKFKDYAPMSFAYIRRMFGINEFEFIQSICKDANYIEFLSNSKSGQFFFYSSDGKYMIKTMSNRESIFCEGSYLITFDIALKIRILY